MRLLHSSLMLTAARISIPREGESIPKNSLKIVFLFDGSDIQVSYVQEEKVSSFV